MGDVAARQGRQGEPLGSAGAAAAERLAEARGGVVVEPEGGLRSERGGVLQATLKRTGLMRTGRTRAGTREGFLQSGIMVLRRRTCSGRGDKSSRPANPVPERNQRPSAPAPVRHGFIQERGAHLDDGADDHFRADEREDAFVDPDLRNCLRRSALRQTRDEVLHCEGGGLAHSVSRRGGGEGVGRTGGSVRALAEGPEDLFRFWPSLLSNIDRQQRQDWIRKRLWVEGGQEGECRERVVGTDRHFFFSFAPGRAGETCTASATAASSPRSNSAARSGASPSSAAAEPGRRVVQALVRDERGVCARDKSCVSASVAMLLLVRRVLARVLLPSGGVGSGEVRLDAFLLGAELILELFSLRAQLKVDPRRSLDEIDRVAVRAQAEEPGGEGVVEAVEAGVDEFERVEVRGEVADAVGEFGEDGREVDERLFEAVDGGGGSSSGTCGVVPRSISSSPFPCSSLSTPVCAVARVSCMAV